MNDRVSILSLTVYSRNKKVPPAFKTQLARVPKNIDSKPHNHTRTPSPNFFHHTSGASPCHDLRQVFQPFQTLQPSTHHASHPQHPGRRRPRPHRPNPHDANPPLALPVLSRASTLHPIHIRLLALLKHILSAHHKPPRRRPHHRHAAEIPHHDPLAPPPNPAPQRARHKPQDRGRQRRLPSRHGRSREPAHRRRSTNTTGHP